MKYEKRTPEIIERAMIAPCGMDCALCLAISRKKDQCPGCRGSDEGKPKYCVSCKMVTCDLAPEGPDGKFCFTCSSFPCRRLKDLDKRYRTKYSMSMLENLATIRDEGLDHFIEKERKRWICQGCGGIVSVHRNNCLSCGYKWREVVRSGMVETVYFPDRKGWRKWLSENFNKKDEIWLIIPKRSSNEKKIPYNETVEEALCFGWIDSVQRPSDEHQTIQRFSPRRKNSNWAQTNIERLNWLDRQGLLHPTVKESVKDLIGREFVFPSDILDEIMRDPLVWKNYQAFSDPYKRIRIAYIDDARDRPDEFRKRLKNFIEKTRQNKMIGYGGIEKYY